MLAPVQPLCQDDREQIRSEMLLCCAAAPDSFVRFRSNFAAQTLTQFRDSYTLQATGRVASGGCEAEPKDKEVTALGGTRCRGSFFDVRISARLGSFSAAKAYLLILTWRRRTRPQSRARFVFSAVAREVEST
jgi:hypothetical protein